jgi:hypothetical protein
MKELTIELDIDQIDLPLHPSTRRLAHFREHLDVLLKLFQEGRIVLNGWGTLRNCG